ncbi:MAG: HAD hydrolase-like protein [Nanoarchaeota archaeon]|nr:HAD hydrolase-like protein [Nanoarchaeota archaeon]
MKQPVIAVDFGGTLIHEEPSGEAHKEWFRIMGTALDDDSVNKYAGMKDYFPKVYEVMERYTGIKADNEFNKKLLSKFARNLFQLTYIGVAHRLEKDKLLYVDFAKYLRELKDKKIRLALITTTPEDAVIPLLELAGCSDLFDYVYKSKLTSEPSKKELLNEFIKEYGEPICYIGNSGDDINACKELEVVSVQAAWSKEHSHEKREIKPDFVAEDVSRLKEIISELLEKHIN